MLPEVFSHPSQCTENVGFVFLYRRLSTRQAVFLLRVCAGSATIANRANTKGVLRAMPGLPLRFHTQMGARFFKGLPSALDEKGQHLLRCDCLVGAEQCWGPV